MEKQSVAVIIGARLRAAILQTEGGANAPTLDPPEEDRV